MRGKALTPEHFSQRTKDHPRLCGEKPYFYDAVTQRVGSPPPMRGKDHAGVDSVDDLGITPAYAGKRVFAMV